MVLKIQKEYILLLLVSSTRLDSSPEKGTVKTNPDQTARKNVLEAMRNPARNVGEIFHPYVLVQLSATSGIKELLSNGQTGFSSGRVHFGSFRLKSCPGEFLDEEVGSPRRK